MAASRRSVLVGLALTAVGIGLSLGLAALLWVAAPRAPLVAKGIRYAGRITGLRPLPRLEPPLAAERTDLRRLLIAEREGARAAHDWLRAAELNGLLGAEAFGRAHRLASEWLARRSPGLGLLPHTLDPREARVYWNPKDCAADLYAHLVNEALLIAPDHLPAVTEMLAAERALDPDLPATVDLESGRLLDESPEMRVFGAVEYAKDGLLSILEASGAEPWADRLVEVVDQIERSAPTPSRFGSLPSNGTEKNGEMLQVLARLLTRTREPRFLERGRRIADAYCEEVLPGNAWLPAELWDFTRHRPTLAACRLADHANEIIPGLVEWTIAEATAPNGEPGRYRAAVERMLDRLLDAGRDHRGMWLRAVSPAGPMRVPGRLADVPNDTWGYLSSAYVAYASYLPEDSPARHRYLEAARRSLRAVTALRAARWEEGRCDGYADALESALYLLGYFDDDEAAAWVDDEIGVLFAYQRRDGLVGGDYLDGNFIRTSLLYGMFRSQGVLPRPWAPHVSVGACPSPGGLVVALTTTAPWHGRLVFDRPRHSEIMHLAADYPRLNAWPQWFTAASEAECEVEDLATGARRRVAGRELREGLSFELAGPGRVGLRVRCIPATGSVPGP